MKKRFYIIYTVILALLVFAGCQDKTDLTAPTMNPKSGNADLTRFVVIGNSLAAGYQSGALYASAQQYSFGNQIAKQVGTTYEMPLISDPGSGGRIEIKQLFPLPPVLTYNTNKGQPTNLNYPMPYNDLGVPGALLYDVMNATSSTTCASYVFSQQPNPFFDLILRGQGTQFAQAKAMHPTFVILWIGNNDVLGFATSGGVAPNAPTPTPTFQYLYSQLADSVASLGAQVVVANIPEVTAIPYFTTVGPVMAQEIPWDLLRFLHVPGLMYQKHGEVIGTAAADSSDLANGNVLITLPGSNYASLIGDTTGAFDKAYYGNNIPVGIDTHQPFGFSPFNPWPDGLILDPSEITTAQNSTAAFNATIAS